VTTKNISPPGAGRFRSYLQFVAAVLYFFVARSLAQRGALALAGSQTVLQSLSPLIEQAFLALLLVMGYGGMGFLLDRQQHPVSEQGWPRRPGWPAEAVTGLAIGWAISLACVLPLTLMGGIAIVLSLEPSSWGWLLADAAFFALAALAEEVAFRGYGFQRFAHAVGPVGAALGFAAYYAILQAFLPGASRASIMVSVALSLLLSIAYLRTGALWLSWGLNFGWKASRALLFGLAVSGVNSHSPVVQGDPMGPFWLTGGGFGLDGSWVAFVFLLVAFPVVYRLTRDLDYRYNAPVIVPGGIPVDLDAASHDQHEAAMGAVESATPALVQILPATPPTGNPANGNAVSKD
jgi:membrane protease YdiL (CAAX protease family)